MATVSLIFSIYRKWNLYKPENAKVFQNSPLNPLIHIRIDQGYKYPKNATEHLPLQAPAPIGYSGTDSMFYASALG